LSSDDILARAEAALQRHGATPRLMQRAARRKRQSARAKIGRIALVAVALAIAVPAWGLLVGPVGAGGLMLTVLAFVVMALVLSIFPRDEAAPAETLPTTELALLPLRTEEWLASQRPALPAPAARLIDNIGVQLEILAPQLQTLDAREPAAAEIRRLIADDLPELVKGYQRVPQNLRRDGINGMSPDKQLLDGLGVVESELGRMSEQLATGDLNKLATQGRYLVLKYQDGGVSE
jgi:hypothetical protein